MLREENVAYKSLEFHGEGVPALSIADRMTLANVTAEMGLKSAAFPPDDKLADISVIMPYRVFGRIGMLCITRNSRSIWRR